MANPLLNIHEIYRFYAPIGATKYFKFGAIQYINQGF